MPEFKDRQRDAELLAAINAGDPGAFDLFVELYGRRLLAFGIKVCGGKVEDAEDVFQDTLLRAFQSLKDLRDPAAVRTWLFRVAANACLMMRRKTGPRRQVSLEEMLASRGESAGGEVADGSPLPDALAARAADTAALDLALSHLSPDLRMVVLLRDVEGLDTAETAEVLQLGASAVKMRLHRARKALRQALEEPSSAKTPLPM